jgi:dihydrofolate synthase/folylpolyglutamate synthase
MESLSNQPITMIMGVLADKEYDTILSELGKFIDRFIAVTPNNPRALSALELCNHAKLICHNTSYCDTYTQAIDLSLKYTPHSGAIIVCGSLYLAAEIRPLILNKVNLKS